MSSSEQLFRQYTSSANEYTSQHEQSDQESLHNRFLNGLTDSGMIFLECAVTHMRIIHICLEEILANHQSAVMDESTYSNIDDRLAPRTPVAFGDGSYLPSTVSQSLGLQHLEAEPPGQECGMLPQGSRSITVAPPSRIDFPFDQVLPGRVSCIHSLSFAFQYMTAFVGTFSPISQPLHPPSPQHVTYIEGQTMPGPSANHNEELIMLGDKQRVRCRWPGCSSIIRKDNRTRHENKTHLQEFKFFCGRCGKGFPRAHMRKNHERTCHGPSSR